VNRQLLTQYFHSFKSDLKNELRNFSENLRQFEFKTIILTKKMPKYSKSVTQGRGHSTRSKNQIKRKDGNN
jgi:hypothetical protein